MVLTNYKEVRVSRISFYDEMHSENLERDTPHANMQTTSEEAGPSREGRGKLNLGTKRRSSEGHYAENEDSDSSHNSKKSKTRHESDTRSRIPPQPSRRPPSLSVALTEERDESQMSKSSSGTKRLSDEISGGDADGEDSDSSHSSKRSKTSHKSDTAPPIPTRSAPRPPAPEESEELFEYEPSEIVDHWFKKHQYHLDAMTLYPRLTFALNQLMEAGEEVDGQWELDVPLLRRWYEEGQARLRAGTDNLPSEREPYSPSHENPGNYVEAQQMFNLDPMGEWSRNPFLETYIDSSDSANSDVHERNDAEDGNMSPRCITVHPTWVMPSEDPVPENSDPSFMHFSQLHLGTQASRILSVVDDDVEMGNSYSDEMNIINEYTESEYVETDNPLSDHHEIRRQGLERLPSEDRSLSNYSLRPESSSPSLFDSETEPLLSWPALGNPFDSDSEDPELGSEYIVDQIFQNAANEIFSGIDVEGLIADPGFSLEDTDGLKEEPEVFKFGFHEPNPGCYCHWCHAHWGGDNMDEGPHNFNEWCHCWRCERFRILNTLQEGEERRTMQDAPQTIDTMDSLSQHEDRGVMQNPHQTMDTMDYLPQPEASHPHSIDGIDAGLEPEATCMPGVDGLFGLIRRLLREDN